MIGVESYLPAWSHKFHADKLLTSLASKDKKTALETEQNDNIFLGIEEVYTRTIMDASVEWLID